MVSWQGTKRSASNELSKASFNDVNTPSKVTDLETARESLVRYCFTSDLNLVNDYWAIRRKLYYADNRSVGFRIFSDGFISDSFLRESDVLVVRKGNECLGGACLTISYPEAPTILPLESDIIPAPGDKIYSLKTHFPQYDLENEAYGEFSRMAVVPGFRDRTYSKEIFRSIIQRSLDSNMRYIFGMADERRARLYKQISKFLGFTMYIHSNISLPAKSDYENVQMYIISSDLHVRDEKASWYVPNQNNCKYRQGDRRKNSSFY